MELEKRQRIGRQRNVAVRQMQRFWRCVLAKDVVARFREKEARVRRCIYRLKHRSLVLAFTGVKEYVETQSHLYILVIQLYWYSSTIGN